jgi:hypothetical protein
MNDFTRPMWAFSTALPHERVERLLSYASYGAVLDLIVESVSVLAFEWESFKTDRLKGCHRASYLLQVSSNAYDAFFNSPEGYRGQFALSIRAGEAANHELLNTLKDKLFEFESNQRTIPLALLKTSLNAVDAKVWIFEREVEKHLGDDTPEILYTPWQLATSDGVGPRAPLGCKLEVKGGWLDLQGREHRDPYKASRSNDIHTVGFS